MHPTELLPYLLGELSPLEQQQVELHLLDCAECQRDLRLLQEEYEKLIEALPQQDAPASAWHAVQSKLETSASERFAPVKPKSWQPWAVAAGIIVALSTLFWGYQQRQSYVQVQAEQRKVAGWLSRPDVVRTQFLDEQGERLGSVLTLSDGRALFVFRRPPPGGQVYEVWGETYEGRTALAKSNRTLLEVPYSGFDRLGATLAAQGDQSTVLGSIAVPKSKY